LRSSALKRRVLVLQAVEHAQLEGANHPFKRFTEILREDEKRVNELESGITSIVRRVSALEIKRYGGIRSIMFTQGEVDDLLRASYRLRALSDEVDDSSYQLMWRSRSSRAPTVWF
jgi:hypothetical protein